MTDSPDPSAGPPAPPPSPAVAPLRAAQAHHKANRLAEAEVSYRRALSLHPGHPIALHGLGLVQHQAGRHQEALALLREAVRGTRGAPPAKAAEFRCNLAAVLGRLGRHAEAAAELEAAVRLAPASAEAYRNLGVALEQGEVGRLAEVRAGLRGRMRRSAITDAEGYAARLLHAWRRMGAAGQEVVSEGMTPGAPVAEL